MSQAEVLTYDSLPTSLDYILMIIASPLHDGPDALPANFMMSLRRARERPHESELDNGPEPTDYSWARFVKLVAPSAATGVKLMRFALRASLPPRHGQAVESMLLSETSFHAWLSLIAESLLEGSFNLTEPLPLSPPGDISAPPRHQARSEGLLEYYDDISAGLLSKLQHIRFAVTDQHAKDMFEFFQLSADDPQALQSKVLPGMNPARPLLPYQLEGIYRLIHNFAHPNRCSGQYLGDEEGLFTHITLLAIAVLCHVARLIEKHVDSNPGMHHPNLDTAQHPTDTCPQSAGFGIQCICVRGSLLARFLAQQSRSGCTVIVCNPDRVPLYRFAIQAYLRTKIASGPLAGKPAAHAYIYQQDGKLEPVSGFDNKAPKKRRVQDLMPTITTKACYRDNSVQIQLPDIWTSHPAPQAIEDAFGDGGDEASGHFMRYHNNPVTGDENEDGVVVHGSTVVSEGLLLVLSRDLVESDKESTLCRNITLNAIDSQWDSDDDPLVPISFSIRTAIFSTSLFFDLDRKPFKIGSADLRWMYAQRVRCREARDTRRPFIVLASPAPFPANLEDFEPVLTLLCEGKSDILVMQKVLRDLVSAASLCRRQIHGCDSVVVGADLGRALASAVDRVDPYFVARNQWSLIGSPPARVYTKPWESETFFLRHQTPPQYQRSLRLLTQRVKEAIQQIISQNPGGGIVPIAQILPLSAFQETLRASAVPALLAERSDTLGQPFLGSYDQIEADLPPSLRGGRPGVDPPRGPDGRDWPCRILGLSRRGDILDDPWLADTIKILAEAARGALWHPRGIDTSNLTLAHPRAVVISCPLPLTTLHTYYALRNTIGESIEAYLLTREWPPAAQRRAVVVRSWEERARDLQSQNIQGQQSNPKVLVAIISTDVLESLGSPLEFASILIILGESLHTQARLLAATRVYHGQCKYPSAVYIFTRSDNYASDLLFKAHYSEEN
ncbi:hypothetical protein FDECE_15351 [Fusarium decemcellulare]|nr:hypothetical protein FDECE_15351 [Fusarium decemcellulare]